MSKPILVPIFWDFDLTITKRYQQVPLFTKYKEKIKKALAKSGITYSVEEDYWKRIPEKNSDQGVAYMQTILWDAQAGGIFDGLTNDELYELGRGIQAAPGFIQMLKELSGRFEGQAILHHYIVSVGLRPMILGFLDENKLTNYVAGVAASEYFTNEKGQINGIRRVVSPFSKNEWIIGFMKGSQQLLNHQLKTADYKYSYKNMIVIGDGFTDASKFAYAKKKGGTPCAVYIPKDEASFEKAKNTVGVWVDYLFPRDYTPNKITFKLMMQIIESKIKRSCAFRPISLHDFKKGGILHPDEMSLIKHHISCCPQCQNYFSRFVVEPSGKVVESCVMKFPKDQEKLSQFVED